MVSGTLRWYDPPYPVKSPNTSAALGPLCGGKVPLHAGVAARVISGPTSLAFGQTSCGTLGAPAGHRYVGRHSLRVAA